MAKEVTKKDGTKIPFDAGKIKSSIASAAKVTDLSEEKQNEVVEQVATVAIQMAEAKEEITTTEIRDKILSELDSVEPSVSASWRKHDEEKKES